MSLVGSISTGMPWTMATFEALALRGEIAPPPPSVWLELAAYETD
jgi:hypothetical protein